MSAFTHPAFARQSTEPLVQRTWWSYLLWIPTAGLLGFAIAELFAGLLQLPLSIYLIPYMVSVSLFVYAFFRWSRLSLVELCRHNWVRGIVGALLVGAFLVFNVISQPASARAEGLTLAFDLVWAGVLYGMLDALILSVLPVLAIWQAFSLLGWTAHWPGKIAVGAIAVIASLFVTVCYHLGYPEYRAQGAIFAPTTGNGVITLGYLLTSNPLTAILSHIAMHVAGVLHGPASVMQLPPHY